MHDAHTDLELIDLQAARDHEDQQGGNRARAADTATRRRAGRPTRSAAAVVLAAVVLGVWGLLAYRQIDEVRVDLVTARDQLDQALVAFGDGDLTAAADLLVRSGEVFSAVPDRVSGPVVAPARLVPHLGRTLDAVADLAVGAEAVVTVGLDVTQVLDVDDGGLGALAPADGRIPIDTFEALAPVLAEAEIALAEAVVLVEGVPRSGIDAQVRDARDEFLGLAGPAADQLTNASRLAEILPVAFGGNGPRSYMVVAANPTESRGSGGFLGAYTVMEAADGLLSFSEVRPTQELPVLPRGQIPWPDASLEERYDAYGGAGFVLNLNMTPDFPSAAAALENYYSAATGAVVDGVIAVDPFAFEALLRIAGPVEVPGYGTVGPDEVVEFVSHDAYSVILDPDERKRLIGLVATAALQGFLASPADASPTALIAALGEMVDRGSVLMHSVHEEEQLVLEDLGVAGALGGGSGQRGDMLAVHLNSGSPSKVDYWLERRLRYDVVLAPGGLTASTLSTGFINNAPTSGEPGYMIGNGIAPLDAGDVLSFVSIYCREGCRFFEIPDAGFDGLETEEGSELGFGVSSTWMRLPSEQQRELIWSYSTPDGWTTEGLNRVYRLHYDHQPTIIPTQLQVGVEIPEGFEATTVPEGASIQEGRVVVVLDAVSDTDLVIVFAPVGSQPG